MSGNTSKPVKRATMRERTIALLEGRASGWLTTAALAARLGCTSSTLHTALRVLLRENIVEKRDAADGSQEVEWRRSTSDIAGQTKHG